MSIEASTRVPHAIAALLAAGALLGGPWAGAARADPQADRIVGAFSAWAARHGVPNAAIAVAKNATLTGSFGKGTHAATTDVPVASLSKAITAICIQKLVEGGQVRYADKLRTVLGPYLRSKPPADARVNTITVGQLLTHSSGLHYDPSQGGPVLDLPHNQVNLAEQLNITFAQNLGATPGTGYRYNNMNYAVLGYIVETIAGESYVQHCTRTVLTSLGIRAVLNPPWRIMSSWGGWKISADDYIRFLAHYDRRSTLLARPPSTWAKFALSGGASYTLGSLTRTRSDGFSNFWHDGRWVWGSSSFGGYFAVLGQDVRYVANYEPAVSGSAVSDLDASLYNAAVGAPAVAGRAAPGGLGGPLPDSERP